MSVLSARIAGRRYLSVLALFSLISLTTPAKADEFRGYWVDAWGAGFLTAAQVTTLVNHCTTYNYNAVVVQMRRRGDAFYMPQAPNLEPRTTAISGSYDALQELITKCHAATPRIEVHCWTPTHLVWSTQGTPPSQAGHVYNTHPEYLMKNSTGSTWVNAEGYYMDPGHPGATQWNHNMAKDIVSRYDIDGYHWDYIRYPTTDSGYNDTAIARYNAEFGLSGQPSPSSSQFSTWRRRQVTDFLRWTNSELLAIKPNLIISAAVFGSRSDAFNARYQDWAAWNNEGIIDLCMTMTYSADNGIYNSRVDDQFLNQGIRWVYVGQGSYLNTRENSVTQFNYARNKGLSGVLLYSYRTPNSGTVNQTATFTHIRDNFQPTYEPTPLLPWKVTPTKGIIKGTITRSDNGAAIDNATVTINTVPSRNQKAESHGKYAFFETPPGTYTITATASGLGTINGNITVAAGGVVNLNLVVPTTDTTPPNISGVASSSITDSAATISWTTDENSDSVVEYGPTTGYGSSTSNPALVQSHVINLTTLSPLTLYHYRVKSKDAGNNTGTSGDFTFTTNASGAVNDIIIDNLSATFTGSFSTGTSATDKFATDYRYKSQGTGAAFGTFTPNILSAGNYQVLEWHPQGGNRPTDAPHTVTYNGGSQSVSVNQQVAGGSWNSLGTWNFAAGTAGNVKIADNFSVAGNVVMVDAIKFVYVPPVAPPAAPTALVANASGSFQVNLTWSDNSANESNFVVARSTTAGGPYTDIVTLGANTTAYNNTGLSPDTAYYYVVRASNSGGASANSNEDSAATLPLPPTAPSALSATAISATEINLSWTDNSSNEDLFTISRSASPGGPYSDINTVSADVSSFSDTGLTASTTYYYVVRASNTGGSSANSNEDSATTLPPAPIAPGGLGATTAGTTQINLAWTDNSTNEVNMIVSRGSAPGGPYTDVATLAANTATFNDTGLTAGTTYYYVVRATNAGGDSPNSNEATATTQVNPPLAPSGLNATPAGSTQINLSWTDNSSNETNFIVGRSTTSGGPYADIITLGANVTSYNNNGLSAATTYYYVVRATNAGGSSANSPQATATTLPNPPAAPGGLGATAVSSSQINLSWIDNSSDEANFVVARSTTSGGPYTDIITLGANVTSYNNTGLTAATTYYYVVRATNTGGASANSSPASASTLPNPPAAPGGLGASAVSSSQINLSWTDNSSNEANFVVARSLTSGGPYTDIITLGANVTTYNNTGLTAATTHFYVVRAVNAGGNSANSGQAFATTLPNAPAAPSGLSATAFSSTQINLLWSDNSSNEVNFIVGRATVSGGPYTDIATLGANVTAWNDTGRTPSTTYYYVVRATNTGGSSANSSQASATTPAPPSNDVTLDNGAAVFAGTWTLASSASDKFGSDYRWANSNSAATATYNASVAAAGNYQVQVWYPQGSNRADNTPITVNFNGGSLTYAVNQQTGGGVWNTLGTHYFAAGGGQVVISAVGANPSVVMADAVRFVYLNATTPVTVNFDSNATDDGWVLESGENTNLGGSTNSSNSTLLLGDNNQRRQYKSLLSFDTSSIPDGATIQSVTLKVTRSSLTGTPATTLGPIVADIKSPNFGAASTTAVDDFAAVSGSDVVATVPEPSGNNVQVTAGLNSIGVLQTNKLGKTQIRIRYTLDDDNDSSNDYLSIHSGSATTTTYRPKLEVQYTQ